MGVCGCVAVWVAWHLVQGEAAVCSCADAEMLRGMRAAAIRVTGIRTTRNNRRPVSLRTSCNRKSFIAWNQPWNRGLDRAGSSAGIADVRAAHRLSVRTGNRPGPRRCELRDYQVPTATLFPDIR